MLNTFYKIHSLKLETPYLSFAAHVSSSPHLQVPDTIWLYLVTYSLMERTMSYLVSWLPLRNTSSHAIQTHRLSFCTSSLLPPQQLTAGAVSSWNLLHFFSTVEKQLVLLIYLSCFIASNCSFFYTMNYLFFCFLTTFSLSTFWLATSNCISFLKWWRPRECTGKGTTDKWKSIKGI